jgi:hypothetical protein
MKRHPALLPLSRDHHDGLVQAVRLRRAAADGDASARLAAAGELLEAHIRLEERQLFPLIEELVPDDELARLALAGRDATCAVRRPPLTSESKLVQPRE